MAADEKWYFTKEQLQNTPSRRCGFDADKELSYRQQAANFIQDMGQKLQVSQLCINTAIVYMHRFYMFHSFTHFSWNTVAATSFFLAAKVEEQPRKLEHVIRVANLCLHREQAATFDAKSEQYTAQSQDLVFNENVLLQTLGFDVAIDHPHTHVVRCCHLVRASKDLAQTSYFMASNSLHLTTMCLQYKPTVVACFCIHLTCKWSNWQIPKSNEGKDWFYYVDKTVSLDLLEQLTSEFLKIFDKCPSRLKRKISSYTTINQNNTIDQLHAASTSSSPFDPDSRKYQNFDKDCIPGPTFHSRMHHDPKPALLSTPDDPTKKPSTSQSQHRSHSHQDIRDKKERIEREKVAQKVTSATTTSSSVPNAKHSLHHRPPSSIDSVKNRAHHRSADGIRESLVHSGKDSNINRDLTNGRERDRDRDHQKYLLAQQQQHVLPQNSGLTHNSNSNNSSGSSDHVKLLDTTRQKSLPPQSVVDGKIPLKQHDVNRHREREKDKYQKLSNNSVNSASDIHKKPNTNLLSTVQDKSNSSISKQINSVSHKHKSPFSEVPKSVPVQQHSTTQPAKAENRNGSGHLQTSVEGQLPILIDDSTSTFPKKTASLFSPEKTPPPSKKTWIRSPPKAPSGSVLPAPISPFNSPPPVQYPKIETVPSVRRSRTSSSGSEPELRPVVKKLDEISGYENIIRDSKMGIKLPKVPEIIQPISDKKTESHESLISKDLKPPDIIKPFNTSGSETLSQSSILSQPIINGIETDPAAISTLLKESAPTLNHLVEDVKHKDHLLSSVAPIVPSIETEKRKSEHHHKSEKKKKKDKHKHKDKEKSKDEKKKKHKDKDKERHKLKSERNEATTGEPPLKITISKEKLQPPVESVIITSPVASTPGSGLKVKISKERLKNDVVLAEPAVTSALKIKISKDQLNKYQYNSTVNSNASTTSNITSTINASTTSTLNNSRKRERDKVSTVNVNATATLPGIPPVKVQKTTGYNTGRDSSRQNGRNSYNKVAQRGDGEGSQFRLAESKYHSKGATKPS